MTRKSKQPLFKESTLNILYLLMKEQICGNKGELDNNRFELLRECKNQLQKFSNKQYNCDQTSEGKCYIPFKSIPNKLLPWIFYGLLLMVWASRKDKDGECIGYSFSDCINKDEICSEIMNSEHPIEWLYTFCLEPDTLE